MTTLLEHGLRVARELPGYLESRPTPPPKTGSAWTLVNRRQPGLVRNLPDGTTALVDTWDPVAWSVITKSFNRYDGTADTTDEGMVAVDAWLVANRHIEPEHAASPTDSGWVELVGFTDSVGPDAWVRIVRIEGFGKLLATVTMQGWDVILVRRRVGYYLRWTPAIKGACGVVGGEAGKAAVNDLLLRSALTG